MEELALEQALARRFKTDRASTPGTPTRGPLGNGEADAGGDGVMDEDGEEDPDDPFAHVVTDPENPLYDRAVVVAMEKAIAKREAEKAALAAAAAEAAIAAEAAAAKRKERRKWLSGLEPLPVGEGAAPLSGQPGGPGGQVEAKATFTTMMRRLRELRLKCRTEGEVLSLF